MESCATFRVDLIDVCAAGDERRDAEMLYLGRGIVKSRSEKQKINR